MKLASFVQSLSRPGLVLGTLFVAAALTPTLVPRSAIAQGLINGLSFSAGYAIAVLSVLAWHALMLPRPVGRVLMWCQWLAACLTGSVCVYALWHAAEWQNKLRALMGLDPIRGLEVLTIVSVTIAIFVVLVVLARVFRFTLFAATRRLEPVLRRPIAVAGGLLLTAWLFYSIGSGLLVNSGMKAFDRSYAELNGLFEEAHTPPDDPLKTGSPQSLLEWRRLGRAGREMVAAEPSRLHIAAVTGRASSEPLRVYVGLSSIDSVEGRARLALAELIRVGAFNRSTLVIATPTGTGWIDPEGQAALEFLLHGDVATVAVQYSYLPSWLALLAESDYGAETARAVFSVVYEYWKNLPKASRPRLYLYGLSLGALNSDLSHDLYQVIGDPYDGAFWVGPPFSSRTWTHVTRERNAGTPAWLPVFRDGSTIRFTAQGNEIANPAASWGTYRIVFLQYASDPITFFDPGSLWRRPPWLQTPLGPDVTPDIVWIPVVTFVQLTIDLFLATTTPLGHGHVYAFEHYLDGWFGLIAPPGWTPESIAALKATYAAQRR